MLNSGSLENGAETENDTSETPQQESGTASGSHNGGLEQLQAQLQSSIDGNTNIKTNLENVQKNLSSVPDAVLNVVKAAYPDYQDYVDLLGSCIVQLNSDIEQQTSVKELIGTLENQMLVGGAEGENDRTEQEAESQPIDTSSVLSLLAKLSQTETEKSTLYDRLITIQSEQILTLEEMVDQQGGTQTEESESTQSESQTESDGSIQGELQTESDGSAQSNPQPENEGGQQSGSQNEGENQQPESSDGLQNGMLPRGQDGASSLADGSAASGFGMPSSGASAGITGGSFGGAMSGSGGTASGLETSELLSGYGNTGANELSDDEISLFGSTYDLSQVKELLEREPSDSDTAQELLEQLYDQKETVTSQYEELLRNQKATELKIQYTYDTTVLAGELAAFTWEQEIQEWDEQLAQAKSEKAELEEIKEWLSSMEEGIVTADRDGLISSVSCETGDVLAQDTPVLGYYNTDTVTITFTVPQEEINQVQVGDTVSVDVGGWQTDAEIRERAADPVSGTSRTTVEYEVTVSLENEEGFYSAGTSATVTVDAEGKADSGNNTEQVKENE